MQIIKIVTTENGLQTVSAKDLYHFLEPKAKFNDWIRRMLTYYGCIEDVDFYSFLSESIGGRPSREYILSLDCAKSIAMVQRSPKGKQIRSYFIEAEKQFKAIATPEQIRELYNRLTILESRQIDYTEDWTVERYLRACNLLSGITNTHRQQLGKLCTKSHRQEYGTDPKKVPHPSYTGGQNVYPYTLINTVFKEWKAKH